MVAFEDTLVGAAIVVAALSLAFVWCKATSIPWRPGVLAMAIGLAVLGVRAWLTHEARGRKAVLYTLLGLALLTLIRWIPLADAIAPPGGDMSMHTLLSRIAVDHDVLPATQTPYYRGVPYGSYPIGFHGLVATLATLGLSLVTASLLVSAYAHALFAAAVAVQVRQWTTWPIAACTALVATFAVRDPQAYIGWGGNPCVLGFALLLFAVVATRRAFDHPRPSNLMVAAILVAGTLAIHATAGAVLALVLTFLALAHLGVHRSARALATVTVVAVLALVIAVPVVDDLVGTEFSAEELQWLREHHLRPPQSPALTAALLPDYWKYLGGDVALILGMLGFLARLRGEWRALIVASSMLVVLPYAVIAFRHSGLPGAEVAYPERVLLILVVPWSYLVSGLIETLVRRWTIRDRQTLVRSVLVVSGVAIVAASVVNASKYYVRPARDQSLDMLDVQAFDALAAVVGPETRVLNRGGDPAAFLPGLWGVTVTHPQWNPICRDELNAWRAAAPAEFVVWRGARPEDLAATRPWRTFVSAGDTVWVARRIMN